MITFITLVVLGGCTWIVRSHWLQFNERVDAGEQLGFWSWWAKGLIAPWVVVAVLNTGFWPGLPPLLRTSPAGLPMGWPSWVDYYHSVCLATWLMALGWAAFSSAWMLVILIGRAPNRSELGVLLLLGVLMGLPVALVLAWLMGGVGLFLALWGWSFWQVRAAFHVLPTRPPAPAYAKAIAKLKMGKREEAEWAVIEQLERFENDFQGWMLLAEVYAEHFGDMRAAEETVLTLCLQEHVNLSEISMALHRLADWYLKVANDPAGARFALEEIGRRMPGTHLDKMARLRLDRLPVNATAWEAEQRRRTLVLPSVQAASVDTDKSLASPMDRSAAVARIEELVAQLHRDPNDAAARETLARLYTEQLGRVDLGLEQLDLLLNLPDQTAQDTLHRLQWKAHWQADYAHDLDGAGRTLRHLIQTFPKTVQAFTAQRRLNLMERASSKETRN